jgi:hypothetical protein
VLAGDHIYKMDYSILRDVGILTHDEARQSRPMTRVGRTVEKGETQGSMKYHLQGCDDVVSA